MVAFTPDEEIGRGVAHFDLNRFPVDYAYTVDGAEIENVDYQTFNAAMAEIQFKGQAIHPGSGERQDGQRSSGCCPVRVHAAASGPARNLPKAPKASSIFWK